MKYLVYFVLTCSCLSISLSHGQDVKPDFLSKIPEFSDLSLAMSEQQFILKIEDNDLYILQSKTNTSSTYHLITSSGENVIAMFTSEKCTGIQRLRNGFAPKHFTFHPAKKKA